MDRLGDLFDFKNGRSFKKTEWAESGLPIIRIQNLNDSSAAFNFFQGKYDKSIEVNSGDLLFSWSGTVGSSFGPHIWRRETGVLNQHIFKLGFKTNMLKKYAYYALLFITSEIERSVVGAVGLVHVTKKSLNEFRIFSPSIEEQRRIVAILDQVFADIEKVRANTKQNLKNARELFDSYLQQVFSQRGEDWAEETLGEIADVEYGQTAKSMQDGDFRYVRITDIDKHGLLISENKKYIRHSKEALNFVAQDKDLLMARTGATFAKVLLYRDVEPSVFASYLIRIKFKVEIKNELYWYFSKTKNYWEQAESLKTGAAQPHSPCPA